MFWRESGCEVRPRRQVSMVDATRLGGPNSAAFRTEAATPCKYGWFVCGHYSVAEFIASESFLGKI